MLYEINPLLFFNLIITRLFDFCRLEVFEEHEEVS